MNKLTLLTSIAGLACALTAQAAYDGTIKISTSALRDGSFGGGPFTAQVKTGLSDVNPEGPSTFLTFCIESNETVGLGSTYNADINSAAVAGGSGGGSPDPLSWGTAYLYSQFRKGAIGTTIATAKALQEAIWWIENENGGSNNSLVGDAVAAYNSAFGAAIDAATLRLTDANGAFGVVALNLYSGGTSAANGTKQQDVLAIVPEPSTYIAGGLALLPLLFGLRARFQRK
jgi:hypothetical protein